MSSESPKPAKGSSKSGSSRRDLLRAGALAAGTMAFPHIVSAQVKGANDKVRVACIGDVTAQSAAGYGLAADIVPRESSARALARAVAEFYYRRS